MSNMIKCGIRFFNVQHVKHIVSQITNNAPSPYQRLCFHTSWILDVKGKELLMPALSPTMENGTIVKWLKKEGESINPGDAVADIQTDKAVMTLELEDESIFAKIVVAEGQNAKIGELIALTVEPDEDWKSVEVPIKTPGIKSNDTLKKVDSSNSTTGSNEKIPEGQTNVSMPALSPTMTSGTIVKWVKQEGDIIEAGDTIAEIQTDKAIMTFDIEENMVLAKILAPEGSKVDVGKIIAIIVEQGFDISKIVIPSTESSVSATNTPTKLEPKVDVHTSSSVQIPESGQVYGLAVKRLLEEYSLSSGSIKGTGRPNRLLKEDVLAHIQSKNLQKVIPKIVPSPISKKSTSSTIPTKSVPQSSTSATPWTTGPSTFTEMDVSNIRSVIAKRLTESKSTIPHSYVSTDICIDNLLEIRKKLKSLNVNVSINDFIIKAVAHVLLECPDVNSLYLNGQIIPQPKVDISVAVSTPVGLVTPIVFNTASKALDEISNDIKTLANKAREGKLQPQEFQGGTFTISNLGMMGVKSFSAIINPPQIAILAVGTGQTVIDVSLNKTTIMNATLSYNRSAIDEEQAANFLTLLQALLQDPQILVAGKSLSLRHKH